MTRANALPIKHWTYSSLITFLRNPLAWYKRYVEEVYDTPGTPASFVGRAGHVALEHFYGGFPKDAAVDLGYEYLKNVPDFEIDFGVATSSIRKKKRREQMEKEYIQAISFYLARPPRHKVVGVEVKATVQVPGLALPVKAIPDLVVESRAEQGALDIIDHKFVDSFSKEKGDKPLFLIQALFNYYTVKETYKRPVRRFLVYECKKKRNRDGSAQLRRYVIDFTERKDDFVLFERLLNDATQEISRGRLYLPNPSDMFEGSNSLDIYRLGLVE